MKAYPVLPFIILLLVFLFPLSLVVYVRTKVDKREGTLFKVFWDSYEEKGSYNSFPSYGSWEK